LKPDQNVGFHELFVALLQLKYLNLGTEKEKSEEEGQP
jgi:hypothetical protein